MGKKIQRINNISLKLSDDEKKRVAFFASERDLSIAEYLRMSALKHKIKPTVVEYVEYKEEQKSGRSDTSNDGSSIEREESELRIAISEHEADLIRQISELTASNGYIDYKKGGPLMLELKKIAERFNEI